MGFEGSKGLEPPCERKPSAGREHTLIIDHARLVPGTRVFLADARERTCFVVANELLTNKGLSDTTYAAAEKTMGLESLVALVALTGSFSMTCMTAGTFDIEAPSENPIPLAE